MKLCRTPRREKEKKWSQEGWESLGWRRKRTLEWGVQVATLQPRPT
jgi:hypothetical protein